LEVGKIVYLEKEFTAYLTKKEVENNKNQFN
jgi:hypothetical protein